MSKSIIKLLSNIFPETFTNIAYNKLANPQLIKLRDHERVVLDKAKQQDITFKHFQIRTYEWANAGEPVLLIHGWEGQAGNFSDLIDKLLEKGLRVYAFDAPAHGYSSKGETNPLEFAQLVGHLLKELKVKRCISHSFGGVAVTYALFQNQTLSLEQLVLVTTPDRFSERISDVANRVGVSVKVQQRLLQRLAAMKVDVSALNVSDFVKQINVSKALILHDINDKVLPFEQSRNVHLHWPQSRLVEVEGTGHFRILRTESVLDQIVEFIV